MRETVEEIMGRFSFHPSDRHKDEAMARLRLAFKSAASVVADELPESRERSVALRKLEEGLFWANAGVARASGANRLKEQRK
jgi:hypothetical protein